MVEAPNQLHHAAQDTEQIKSLALLADEAMLKAKEDGELLKRLKEVELEKAAKLEERRIAMEKDERAKEGKLAIEQELRKWRTDNKQRWRASDVGHGAKAKPNSHSQGIEKSDRARDRAEASIWSFRETITHCPKEPLELFIGNNRLTDERR
ncbi:hypothetical protein IFM89_024062 [Coptis chinensis]|uniref:Uncharacterized protein n=1 Tax=Coptis chinensis TaxID=261450 RepID=A0A835HV31_9MAGN|nr:hypothetical protein IFM89_024062 [Coptis chinensis]